MANLVEDRRLYIIDGRYWMNLTAEELIAWNREAPHLVRYIEGEPCTEIKRKGRES